MPAVSYINQRLSTNSVVLAFARLGTAVDTMARALTVPASRIREICAKAVAAGEIAAPPPDTSGDVRGSMQVEIANLRDKVDELKEKLLAADIRTQESSVWIGLFGLTKSEAKLVHELVEHGRRSKDQLYFALYGGVDDAPDPKIVDVLICKFRKKLPADVTVDTIWGFGYEMTASNRAAMRAMIEPSPSLAPEIADMVA